MAKVRALKSVQLNHLDDGEADEGDESSGDETTPFNERKDSAQKKRAWDSFRDIPVKQTSGSQTSVKLIEYSVRIMKCLAYVLTFLIVLTSGILGKALMLLITSQLKPTKTEACVSETMSSTFTPLEEERILWTWVLFGIFCVPEAGTIIRAGRICFFKNNDWPKLWHFLFQFLMETLHVVGIALLVFEVLPQLDAVRGLMLTNAVCLIPAVLKLLSRDMGEPMGVLKVIADSVAVLIQISALLVWPIADETGRLAIIVPALVLTSCGWWMNYIPKESPKENSGLVGGILRGLCAIRNGINESTLYWTYLILATWKIAIFFCSMLAILAAQGQDIQVFFNKTEAAFDVHVFTGTRVKVLRPRTLAVFGKESTEFESSEFGWLWIAIVQACSAWCCYIFSKFACKVRIQEVSMSLATTLVVPGTIILLVSMDQYQNGDNGDLCIFSDFIPPYVFWNMDISPSYISDKIVWVWVFWMVSQIWITLHIWFPQCERLAKTEKLFATPMYSSILIDQSITLNRKIDDEIVQRRAPDESDDDNIPHVIACATMWHENKPEMLEMLKSVVHMDLDQCIRRIARESRIGRNAAEETSYYTFETHIFFDDVFELEDGPIERYIVNNFVRDMIDCLPTAIREVHRSNKVKIRPAEVYPTPYGGRMVYTLPGKTLMTVHLKDKNKIRHRKRWSQCMYMYYLLGYRIMCRDISTERKDKISQNTFLLALDGDIDFHPKAVRLLVDLMKRNENLGAACGRIHPVGSGLMAWYQTFEYAIGHWLQKATEHMIGCVLCSPGCFSLFRGKALMDDNVMRTYTKNCEAALDYVQYDQGEDRWLCTLLLQRGYRVEYSAASDAYTHCPEDFGEFYKQRRRWVPSTMANIMDLLGSYKLTVKVNSDISMPYIIYQAMMMVGTVLGPGTIFLMLVGAFVAAFNIDNWTSFLYNLIPIIVYIGVCLFFNGDLQIMFALVISTIYGLIMMAVLVGILIQIQEDGPLAPSTLFLFVVAGEIIVAGLFHPQEVYCLPSGAIYYVTIPSMYLLLIIYSVCNLNVVSWGTREVVTKKTKAELEEEKLMEAEQKKKQNSGGFFGFLESMSPNARKEKGSIDFSFAGLFRCMFCTQPQENDVNDQFLGLRESMMLVNKRLDNIEKGVDAISHPPNSRRVTTTTINPRMSSAQHSLLGGVEAFEESMDMSETDTTLPVEQQEERDDLLNPYWIEDKVFEKNKPEFLPTEESTFWKEMIERYLKPIDENKEKKKKIETDLAELRNKNVLAFFMLNALFVTIVFLLQLNKDTIYINWPLDVKSNISYDLLSLEVQVTQDYLQLEPIGLVFVLFFAIILVVQFTGMLLHRFETLCHVLATTDIFPKDSEYSMEKMIESAMAGVRELNEKDHLDQKLDDNVVSRRKTLQVLDDEHKGPSRSSVNLDTQLTKYFSGVEEQRRSREVEKADRRRSSLFLRRKTGAGKSMRPLSTYPTHLIVDTIKEESEDA